MNDTVSSTKLGKLVSIKTGKLNSNAAKLKGRYPFFTCSQETFKTDTYSFDCEVVLLAGNNAAGIYSLKYFSGKFDVYQRTYVLQSKDKKQLDNRYLYYYLRPKLEILKSISTGAATKFLTMLILQDLDLIVPPLPTQRKIAAVLSAYDDLIENNTRRIKILEEMAQMIYREWFVNFHFPGHEKAKMVNSPLGKIPEGWKFIKLEVITEKVNDKYLESKHSNLPLLDLARIPRRSNCINDIGNFDDIKTSRIIFNENDILFGAIRPYFHKVVLAPFSGITNVSVFVIREKKNSHKSYLFTTLFNENTVRWANQHSGGTKMPVISWNVFKDMVVLLPDDLILEKFDQKVWPIYSLIKNLVNKNKILRQTRDLLLPKLISGDVDVIDLDIEVSKEAVQ